MNWLISILLLISTAINDAPLKRIKLYPTKSSSAGLERSINKANILPLQISSERLLVTVGDTLYLLDRNNQVVWKWVNRSDIIAQPVVDSKGVICGIADDGVLFALDNAGHKMWTHTMNGAANYRQILLYDDSQCLIVIDMQGYKERWGENGEVKDRLEALAFGHSPDENEPDSWEVELSHQETIEIWGKKIIAVQYKSDQVEIREIDLSHKK